MPGVRGESRDSGAEGKVPGVRGETRNEGIGVGGWLARTLFSGVCDFPKGLVEGNG